ncbi:hypothetical protein H6P81_005967 [Aristolochia fimbriata]|uniref:Uncharacterized protein n=1 Tax=Aristolochia fimbriata TaxID=158543 RepID=A0AAV7F0J4_ARIFI|nr:hypothetical protein H6P81_005967 [Aristolochia fimbriata]
MATTRVVIRAKAVVELAFNDIVKVVVAFNVKFGFVDDTGSISKGVADCSSSMANLFLVIGCLNLLAEILRHFRFSISVFLDSSFCKWICKIVE